jgi:hypothetical protein
MVRRPACGERKSESLQAAFPSPLLPFLCKWAWVHSCAHLRHRLPPAFVPGKHAGLEAAGCQVHHEVVAAGRPQRLCPSARRGGKSWWPVAGGGLRNKAHQKCLSLLWASPGSSMENTEHRRCTYLAFFFLFFFCGTGV